MTLQNTKENNIFENMPITKALIKLSLPAIFSQVMLVIYNMADTFFVSMTQNNIQIAAITLCMPSLMILNAIANLFGVGAASVMSRAMGKFNEPRAKDTCAFSLWGCLITSIIYSIFSFVFADSITDFLGGIHPDIHFQSLTYIKYTVIFGGWAISMPIVMSHVIRSEGFSFLASIGMICGGVLNIILDPLFMFVIMKKGQEVSAAALATTTSNIISLLFYCVLVAFFLKKGKPFSVKLKRSCFANEIPLCVFQAGFPAFIMTFAENLSYAILDRLMAISGTVFQAGIGVAKKINMLSHSVVRGLTQGALPLLGYAYSTGNRKKTKLVIQQTLLFSILISGVISLLNLVFAPQLIYLFLSSDNLSSHCAIVFLRILTFGCLFSAIAYTFISFFQSVGHGKESLLLALLRKGIIDIPLMFLLQAFNQVYGKVWATPLTDIICCVVSIIIFFNFSNRHLSKNKKRKVYNPETDSYIILDSEE